MQAQAQAAAVREAALAAKEERIEAAAPSQGGAHGASAAEVRARAEHLKKQRDLILAKRKKEREAALPLAQQQQPQPQAAEQAPPAEHGAHRAAGYSSQPVAAERAALSRNLASAMKSSLLGEDSATLDLQYRIDSHQRKVDLELTKQQLRDEGRPEF